MPFIPPMVTAACNILNHTLTYSTVYRISVLVYNHHCPRSMATNGSPLQTSIMAPFGRQFGLQWHLNNNLRSSDNCSCTDIHQDSPCGKHTNQYLPLHRYSFPPSQELCSGTPQFYHHSPFNMALSSQSSSCVSQGFQALCHHGQNITSAKAVMMGLKCSPDCDFQDMGFHP